MIYDNDFNLRQRKIEYKIQDNANCDLSRANIEYQTKKEE